MAIKKGDEVWINEKGYSGNDLPREWYGKVLFVEKTGCFASIEDTNPKSGYYKHEFTRNVSQLELKE